MNDRPRQDGAPEDGAPDFHWLYGEKAHPGDEPRPDETRVMPTMSRPSDAPPPPPPAQPGNRSTRPTPPPVAPTPGTAAPSRRRRGPKFWIGIVLALLLLWVLYLVIVPIYAWTKVDKVA